MKGRVEPTGVRIEVCNDLLYVPVLVNGRGPFSLLLDTGFVGCNVSSRVAEQLQLAVDQAGTTCLRSLAIGCTQWANIRFGVADNSCVERMLGRPIDGFLGNGFFWHIKDEFAVTLDYARAVLHFERARPNREQADKGVSERPGRSRVAIEIENYYTVVPVCLNGQGPFRFLLDTGASECFVSLAIAKLLSLRQGAPCAAHGVVDTTDAYWSEASELAIGGVKFDRQRVVIKDCSRESGYVCAPLDGVIGNSFLGKSAVRLDYRDRILTLG